MSVASFAEESCWDKDQFRQVRKSVVFRVTSVGKIDGVRLDFDVTGDFGVWYDPDDRCLITMLEIAQPDVNWDRLIYWKKMDHSGISILDPETDQEIGSVVVRRRLGGDRVDPVEDRTNVVSLCQFRLARAIAACSEPVDAN